MKNIRREFSTKIKLAAWERCGAKCEGIIDGHRCNAPIYTAAFYYDHIDPDWFSKDNELSNIQVLCKPCHLEKTKQDIAHIAKSKRIIAKRLKARKPTGRPIFGTKASGFRKRMDGTVERR